MAIKNNIQITSKFSVSKTKFEAARIAFKKGKTSAYVNKNIFPEYNYSRINTIRAYMHNNGIIERSKAAVQAWETRAAKGNTSIKRKFIPEVNETLNEVKENPVVVNNSPTLLIDFKGILVEIQKNPRILVTDNKIVIL